MRKVVTVFVVVFMMFALVACGSKPKTTICTTTYEGVNVTNTVVSEGDKVTSITYVNEMTVDESLVPYLGVAAEEYSKQLKGLAGVTYEYKVEGNVLTEKTILDYTAVDFSALVNVGLLETINGEVPAYIDYEASIENMKSLGCTCE